MEKINCTNCGSENPGNIKYCTSCGYELPKVTIEEINTPVLQPASESKVKRNKLLGTIAGSVVFLLFYYAAQQLFFKSPSYDKEMMTIASELNKTCPIMVDSVTRFDNAVALPVNTFQYNYTLIDIEIGSIDTVEFKNYLEPTITNFVKSCPQMKYQRDHNTTINYYYKDKYGNYLFSVSVKPENYK